MLDKMVQGRNSLYRFYFLEGWERKIRMSTLTRDNRFDNLKGLMMFLVVFCHFIEKMYGAWPQDILTKGIYYTVYLFHMPVFIFISGYFSKNDQSDDYFRKVISHCLIPYIFFNYIYGLLDTGGNFWQSLVNLCYPQWTMWYMISLVLWKILARPVSKFIGTIVISILVSLFVGFTNISTLFSLARTFSFFPYFLAGYLLPKETVEKARSLKKVYVLLGFVAVIAVSFMIQRQNVGVYALYMSVPYKNLEMALWQSLIVRMVLLATGFLCILGFLAIAWEKHSVITTLGRNSVLVFLIHSGIIRLLMKVAGDKIDNGPVSILLSLAFTTVVCFLFGNQYTAKAYNTVIKSISGLILKDGKKS